MDQGRKLWPIILVLVLAMIGTVLIVEFSPRPVTLHLLNIYTNSASGNQGYKISIHDNSNSNKNYSQTFTSFPSYFYYPAGDNLTISSTGPSGYSFEYFLIGTEKQSNNPFNATFGSYSVNVMACYKLNP